MKSFSDITSTITATVTTAVITIITYEVAQIIVDEAKIKIKKYYQK